MTRLGVLVAGLCWGATAFADARIEAFCPKTGALRYLGAAWRPDGSGTALQTRWCTPDGAPVIEARSDFDPATYTGKASWKDLRSGRERHTEVGATEVKLAFRKSAKHSEDRSSVERNDPWIVAPESTLDVIRDRWAELEKGETVTVQLAVADIGRPLAFQLSRASMDETTLVVRLEAASWFVRRFVDPMHFSVARSPPRVLRQLEGGSSVPLPDGGLQPLRMVYTQVPAGSPLPCADAR